MQMVGCRLLWFEPARYWETVSEDLAGPEQALERLDELEERFWRGDHLCVSPRFQADDGKKLYVGLAGDHWLLMEVDADDCFSWAIGDPAATGTLWVYFPVDTEVSRKRLVPRATARQAVREWLASRRLAGELTWTDDYRLVD
jgi:hypothetical protein